MVYKYRLTARNPLSVLFWLSWSAVLPARKQVSERTDSAGGVSTPSVVSRYYPITRYRSSTFKTLAVHFCRYSGCTIVLKCVSAIVYSI